MSDDSNQRDRFQIATAVDAGVCAFLPKPFDIAALSALVQSCIPAR